MKKLALPLATIAAAVLGAAAPASAATPAVSFSYVYVDSPGSDNRSAASLDAEYFRLTNNTGAAVALTGWTVRDASAHVYAFRAYRLPAKTSVTVHTGRGTDGKPAAHLYWGSGNYIWNNTGDTATLRNATGATIDSCTWRKAVTTTC